MSAPDPISGCENPRCASWGCALHDDNYRMRAALTELATLGDEPWKTPGHPMNEWVSKSRVQTIARRGLDAARVGEQPNR